LGYLHLRNLEKPVKAYALPAKTLVWVPRAVPQPGVLPSIAVLPLHNLGRDPADDYFAAGIVEDIVMSLAGLRELHVISRASTLTYRGRQVDPREVGRAFGVRYVLTGSVRRSERSVRVSAQLCDAITGVSLWAETVEVAPGDLFVVQDEIVQRVISGIAPNVRASELRGAMRKRPDKFTAYDYTLRALHCIHSLNLESFLQAHEFLTKAMAEDPNFAMPVAWVARWHSLYVGQGWAPDRTEHSAKAIRFATKAIELDPQNALALATYGHLKSYLFHEYDVARIYLDRALLACPNHSLAWILSSGTLSYIGRGKEAVEHAEHALRLSPFDQSLFYYYMFLSLAHYSTGNYEETIKWANMSISENSAYTATYRFLAAGLAGLDRLDEARTVAAALVKLEPSFGCQEYERTRQPFRHPELSTNLMKHLRSAGLPE
jgi:adenylate cyclase